jgi:hypothetical protein
MLKNFFAKHILGNRRYCHDIVWFGNEEFYVTIEKCDKFDKRMSKWKPIIKKAQQEALTSSGKIEQ